ncbi:MAG: radical SAM protein [Dehalococcoidia bacterium]
MTETRHTTFRRPGIIRPPSEWRSYFLPLTGGCSNNTCTFCGYYGSKLEMRDPEEARNEIDAVALFLRRGIRLSGVPEVVYAVAQGWDGKRVFLQDGDALVYPFPRLTDVLIYLNEKLPDVERVGAYATPQDILRRSVGELRELKRLKLGILYTGLETGDDELLEKAGKGVSSEQLIEAGGKVKEAGIPFSLTVILGLGGVYRSREHVAGTARVLTAIDPDYAGALTLTLVPGTPLHDEWQRGEFHPLSPFQSLQELKAIMENSDFTDCFFSSMHASNYLSVRGRLPQDRQKMLSHVERVLASGDPSLLRPEYLRGL